MTDEIKHKPLDATQLWFIYKAIGELKAYLSNQLEAGAEGADEDYDNATKAQKLVLNERKRINGIMNTKTRWKRVF